MSYLVRALNSSFLFNSLITKLFFVKPIQKSHASPKDALNDLSSWQPMHQFPVQFLLVKRWLCCRRYKSKKRVANLAEDKMDRHLDVVKLIEQQVILAAIIRTHFTKQERFVASRDYKATVLDPSCSSASDVDDFAERS